MLPISWVDSYWVRSIPQLAEDPAMNALCSVAILKIRTAIDVIGVVCTRLR
jgi:hypothetical protein